MHQIWYRAALMVLVFYILDQIRMDIFVILVSKLPSFIEMVSFKIKKINC